MRKGVVSMSVSVHVYLAFTNNKMTKFNENYGESYDVQGHPQTPLSHSAESPISCNDFVVMVMNFPFWTGAANQSMISVGLYGRNGAVIFLRERIYRINNKREVKYILDGKNIHMTLKAYWFIIISVLFEIRFSLSLSWQEFI
jgi:hypothetical protein